MSEPDSSFDSVSVAAILAQRGREDRAALLEDLVTMLAEVIPGVQLERALFRRHITSVRLPLGGHVYLLTRNASDSFDAARQQVVRGVAIRTDPMEIEEFLTELGAALDAELQRTQRGRDALRSWLDSRSQ